MTSYNIGSLERGMKILEILAKKNEFMGVTELAKIMNLDKSMVYRLLATLRSKGYIEQDPETRKYLIGPKMVALSSRILGSNDIYFQAKPIMKRVLRETGETVHLAMLMDNQAVYIAQEVSPEVISINTEIGQREPLHCTAVGKALVAFLPEEELDAIIQELDFARHTAKTITSPQVFKAHCLEIRAQGYAVDDEELHEGVRCIGAPVRGYDGIVLASLGISGPSTRLQMDRIPRLAKIVTKWAEEASARLGYVSP